MKLFRPLKGIGRGFALLSGHGAIEPSPIGFVRELQARKIRESLDFRVSPTSGTLILERASDRETIETALALIEESRVRSLVENASDSGLWAPVQLALPEATVVIARSRGEIVGALALIQDSMIGLPADKVFGPELKKMRANGQRLAEITLPSVRSIFWSQPEFADRVALELIKYAHHYAVVSMGAPRLIMRASSAETFAHESILGFRRAGTRVFGRLKQVLSTQSPALLGIWGQRAYARFPQSRNAASFVAASPGITHRFPVRLSAASRAQPVMTHAFLRYFFEDRTDTFARAEKLELELVHSAYRESFSLEGIRALEGFASRPYRYAVNIPVTLRFGSEAWMGRVYDLSEGGLFFEGEPPIDMGQEYEASFQIGHDFIRLRTRPRWANRQNSARHPRGVGLQFVDRDPRVIQAVQAANRSGSLRMRAAVIPVARGATQGV